MKNKTKIKYKSRRKAVLKARKSRKKLHKMNDSENKIF